MQLLYDFDCEPDRFTQVQALLLMTSWYASDEKDGWHWLGIAVATATSIGLHRLSSSDPSHITQTTRECAGVITTVRNDHNTTSTARQGLQKRVWWSLIIRDRLMALGLRRPTCIDLGDSDVPMLTTGDYGDDEHSTGVVHIQMAKLSLCVGHVLAAQYSVQSVHSSRDRAGTSAAHTGSATTLMPKLTCSRGSGTAGVRACHAELEAWRAELPGEVQLELELDSDVAGETTAGSATVRQQDLGGPELLNLALLHLIYYATLSALHRPQMLPQARTGPGIARAVRPVTGKAEGQEVEAAASRAEAAMDAESGTTQTQSNVHRHEETSSMTPPMPNLLFSRAQVYSAATAITDLAELLLDNHLVAHVPTFGTTVLLPAMTKHLVDLRGLNLSSSCYRSGTDANDGHKDVNFEHYHNHNHNHNHNHYHNHIHDHKEVETGGDATALHKSLRGFTHCVAAMRILQDSYPGADMSMALVEAAVKRANIIITTIGTTTGKETVVASCIADLVAYAQAHTYASVLVAGDEAVGTWASVQMQQPTPPSSAYCSEGAERDDDVDGDSDAEPEVELPVDVDITVGAEYVAGAEVGEAHCDVEAAMVLDTDAGIDMGMGMGVDIGLGASGDAEVGLHLGLNLDLDLEMSMQQFLDFEGSLGTGDGCDDDGAGFGDAQVWGT